MRKRLADRETPEIERYELFERPGYRFALDRRDFLRFSTTGLMVVLSAPALSAMQESGRRGRGQSQPRQIQAWLHIDEEGLVHVFTGKAEVGQNIRTSLAQAVCDELTVPLDSVKLVMGDTDLTPYDRGTFGSRTTPVMAPQLRRMAAAARRMLLARAAEKFEAPLDALSVVDGQVRRRDSEDSASFGELTKGSRLSREVSEEEPIKNPRDWTVSGRSAAKVAGESFVTGKHRYTSDLELPGMLHGKVLRPPAVGATLSSLDSSALEEMQGVKLVRDDGFVGVVALDSRTAERAIRAIRAEWKLQPNQPNSRSIFEYLKSHPSESGGWRVRPPHVVGSVENALAAAEETLESSYTVAYIAHAPLEPRAAVARWEEGKLTVWTGTQRPFGVRGELAEAFRIPEEKVRVIMPDTGSGYGGKHTGEAAIEAARLAKAAGKPVKLVWTREEEFRWAYFRPAGVIEVKSGVSKDGRLLAWEFHNYNSGSSSIRTLYEVENQTIQFHAADSPLRQGSYRALAATANTFARETHMDELANRIGKDPLEFRLQNLKEPRLRAVLERAAKEFDWGTKKTGQGIGFGLACGFEKGGYVATCAEVSADSPEDIRIRRVVAAFECGAVVNPKHLENQVEGAIVQGIGGALFEAIEFKDGKIVSDRFSRYRVPRFSDTPKLEVHLIDRQDLPSAGAGEAPIIAIAPAIGNALFSATGKRLRSLPLQNSV